MQVLKFSRLLPVPSTESAAGLQVKQAVSSQAVRSKVTGWELPAHGYSRLTALLLLLRSKWKIPEQTLPAL